MANGSLGDVHDLQKTSRPSSLVESLIGRFGEAGDKGLLSHPGLAIVLLLLVELAVFKASARLSSNRFVYQVSVDPAPLPSRFGSWARTPIVNIQQFVRRIMTSIVPRLVPSWLIPHLSAFPACRPAALKRFVATSVYWLSVFLASATFTLWLYGTSVPSSAQQFGIYLLALGGSGGNLMLLINLIVNTLWISYQRHRRTASGTNLWSYAISLTSPATWRGGLTWPLSIWKAFIQKLLKFRHMAHFFIRLLGTVCIVIFATNALSNFFISWSLSLTALWMLVRGALGVTATISVYLVLRVLGIVYHHRYGPDGDTIYDPHLSGPMIDWRPVIGGVEWPGNRIPRGRRRQPTTFTSNQHRAIVEHCRQSDRAASRPPTANRETEETAPLRLGSDGESGDGSGAPHIWDRQLGRPGATSTPRSASICSSSGATSPTLVDEEQGGLGISGISPVQQGHLEIAADIHSSSGDPIEAQSSAESIILLEQRIEVLQQQIQDRDRTIGQLKDEVDTVQGANGDMHQRLRGLVSWIATNEARHEREIEGYQMERLIIETAMRNLVFDTEYTVPGLQEVVESTRQEVEDKDRLVDDLKESLRRLTSTHLEVTGRLAGEKESLEYQVEELREAIARRESESTREQQEHQATVESLQTSLAELQSPHDTVKDEQSEIERRLFEEWNDALEDPGRIPQATSVDLWQAPLIQVQAEIKELETRLDDQAAQLEHSQDVLASIDQQLDRYQYIDDNLQKSSDIDKADKERLLADLQEAGNRVDALKTSRGKLLIQIQVLKSSKQELARQFDAVRGSIFFQRMKGHLAVKALKLEAYLLKVKLIMATADNTHLKTQATSLQEEIVQLDTEISGLKTRNKQLSTEVTGSSLMGRNSVLIEETRTTGEMLTSTAKKDPQLSADLEQRRHAQDAELATVDAELDDANAMEGARARLEEQLPLLMRNEERLNTADEEAQDLESVPEDASIDTKSVWFDDFITVWTEEAFSNVAVAEGSSASRVPPNLNAIVPFHPASPDTSISEPEDEVEEDLDDEPFFDTSFWTSRSSTDLLGQESKTRHGISTSS